MRPLWRQVRHLLEGNMRQQITKAGLLFSATVALVGVAAFVSANNLLFLLLAALLATMLINGFVSRLGLAGLELNLQTPEHIAARRPIQGRIVVRNRKYLTPSFSLHVSGADGSGLRRPLYIPVIAARSTVDVPVELRFDRRGIHKEDTFAFESRFPFGFTHRRAQVRLEREVLVYPSVDPQPGFEAALLAIAGEIEARQRGLGTDFYRIRPYEYLESARHVDWRATAHTGELQVREFAREQDQSVTIFLDLNVPLAHRDWFEHAVDCCAFLSWRLNDRGTPLRVLTQRFDRRVPVEATVYDVLRYLALAEPVHNAGMPHPDDRNIPFAISWRPAAAADAGWLAAALPMPAAGAASTGDSAA
jgi:uncharacterized protein (DUF58 family)